MRRRLFLAAGAALLVGADRLMAQEFHPEASADVIVVGAGAAGLCAAVSAAEQGASVLLLEKAGFLGGDTLISGGYFNAVDPARQEPMKIHDSVALFKEHILEAGDGLNDPAVAETLARESFPTLCWLEGLGLRFLPQVFEVYGSRWPRAHKPLQPRGTGYVQTLSEALISRGVKVMTDCRVTALVLNEETGRVEGVQCRRGGQPFEAAARRGVVIAAGGFGASRRLIERWAPQMATLAVDSQPGAEGDMIEAAEAVGAKICNMPSVECVPGGPAQFHYPIRLDYRPDAMILVNSEGQRFVDELLGRRAIADAVLSEEAAGRACWCVAAQQTVERFDPVERKNLLRGLYAGAVWREATPEKLAVRMGLPEQKFSSQVRQAEASRALERGPYWAVRLYLRIHTTLGGIAANEKAQVLDAEGSVMPGLWAAGETVGSVHGAERIGGNGIAAACTFGRIAGIGAGQNLLF